MKNFFTIILTAALLYAGQGMAQDVKPSLPAAPTPTEAAAAPVAAPAATEVAKASKPSWQGPKLSYSMNLGASFSSGFGNATFVEPSVRYQVSNRFRVSTSLAYVRTTPFSTTVAGPEGTTMLYRNRGGSHYMASVGVDYLASERLMLSGNIWRDFSNLPAQDFGNSPYSPGRMGADFRATYKVTENFSIMGGIRYSDGASPYSSPFYAPGYGSRYGYW